MRVTTDNDVVTVRLDRPAKRNAITSAMYAALADALTAADRAGAAAVVLTGTGGAFTAGSDLQDMAANPPVGDAPPPVRFLAALSTLRAVLVAAIDGPAIGVGTTLLLHCDLVYATQRSTFRLPFVPLGLVPEAASTLLLPRLVGHQRATELMLFGDTFDAAEARRMGLVTALAQDADELARLVAERTSRIAALPRAAVHAAKSLLVDDAATTVSARLDLDRRVLQGLLATAVPPGHDPR
ncbi:enoyl-CoA hydratase-related protein [Pseudonocardia aurantiaca]|uniref:Enoyl-CoA hydratase-related protein n=1 Tax=Pseudonocardia aurantiaca TaxID=75290 RepID=A0ABW4FPB9_9PSEU